MEYGSNSNAIEVVIIYFYDDLTLAFEQKMSSEVIVELKIRISILLQ